LYVVAFGYLTPGGGFQGGVVVALGLLLVYLAADHRSYRALTPTKVVDVFEGGGAAAFVALALGVLAGGLAFQQNFLPLGKLAVGYRKHATAPIFKGIPLGTKATDPVVQALTLTDVVVSVTVLALLLAVAVQVHKREGTLAPEEIPAVHG